jgi:hypothetical protein
MWRASGGHVRRDTRLLCRLPGGDKPAGWRAFALALVSSGKRTPLAPILLETNALSMPVRSAFRISSISAARVQSFEILRSLFVSAFLSGSQFKSFGFNAHPTKHASCCGSPEPGLRFRFTRPYPNFPIPICWGTPSFPPVTANGERGGGHRIGARPTNSCGTAGISKPREHHRP